MTVGRATKYLPDERVMHYLDAERELVKDYALVWNLVTGPHGTFTFFTTKTTSGKKQPEAGLFAGTTWNIGCNGVGR